MKVGLEPPSQLSKFLKSKLHGKYKETLTPPGVAKRNVWGPILFKYCRVEHNQETGKLEIMKGKFVGKCKITRHVDLDKKYGSFSDDEDDDDDDEEYDNYGDVDSDDGQAPVDVVAYDILLGSCFLF